MMKLWNNITASDVKKAIALFDKKNERYPEPRNTFLIYNSKKYPAKHIRGLAYLVANKREISKNEYSGGQETVNFFTKRGFTLQYKNHQIQPKSKKKKPTTTVQKVKKNLNVVTQKNALQRLCQKHLGFIETEKKFDWLKTPNQNNLPNEYKKIVTALSKYRNQTGFKKSNYQLLCDIVLDDQKLILEYDENQHFSNARKITLLNYPKKIQLHFSKQVWIDACQKINAKDNSPIDRDEKRAFYDTVRDIEAYKNGYTLVRIKHGEINWETDETGKHLKQLVKKSEIKKNKHKIARLIVTGKQYDKNGNPYYSKLQKLIERFISKTYNTKQFEFILTPGGFLSFNFPENLHYDIDIKKAEKSQIALIQAKAEETINEFFDSLPKQTSKHLQEIADYFTIGIDGYNSTKSRSIELVAVYDLKRKAITNWTGKFYPTERQKNKLIKINELKTHFVKLNGQRVVILGCHDLNVYNPRGQAKAKPNGWKIKTAKKFKKLCKQYNPDIILQHPHTTDTPNIWNLAWRAIEKELPGVKTFASGIKYYNWNGKPRSTLEKTLERTKKGDVIDYQ